MATPTEKSPEIDMLLEAITGRNRVESVTNDICNFCGDPATPDTFRDELSIKEYIISGLCQKCQDEIFGE